MNNIIEFIRKKDFDLIKVLGQGACGKTVLLNDSIINQYFVCKKYSPYHEEMREELFKNFIREITLLYQLYHQNIVRVFNYYIYPDIHAGYIIMEYIKGDDIELYLKNNPENINGIFFQTISGFKYLEENNILHRDIRPYNIMVREDGIVKIIDFGFGKLINAPDDFDKSISLNWWCELPSEFQENIYNFKTEIYFIGKLFEKIILENSIECFKYNDILKKMCQNEPQNRFSSFNSISTEILNDQFDEIDFSDDEIEYYRIFSRSLYSSISKISNGTKYYSNIEDVQKKIEDLYKNVMLEEALPNNSLIIRCFLNGAYYYNKYPVFDVHTIKSFLSLLRSCPTDKKNIILSNIQTKLDSIHKYSENPFGDDDIPF